MTVCGLNPGGTIINKQAHVLCSSDALEKFLDLLELEFCSFVLERYMYLILLRCFNLDNLHNFFLIYYKIDAKYTRYKMFIVSI